MKKIIISLFVFISLLSLVGCNSKSNGVEEIEPTDCEHEWFNSETRNPTCTEEGYSRQTCNKCGETTEEKIDALGHSDVIDLAVNPTCTNTGLTEGKHCSRCNTVTLAQEEVPALGHTEVVDEGYEPKCEYFGLTDGKHCSTCNTTLVSQERIPVLGHTETTIPGTPATCYVTGLTDGKICSVCEKTLVEQTTIPELGCTYNENNICTTCGDPKPSEGLQFVFDDNTKQASVYRIGSCTDTEIIIPRYYDGMLVTSIYSSAFANKTNITSVIIPDTLTSIGSNAFMGCTGLTNIELPEGLLTIGDAAFKNCSNLTSISIPNSIENIEPFAFDGCTLLEYYEYNNTKYLGNESNKELVLIKADKDYVKGLYTTSQKTRIIYASAFSGCSNLTNISFTESIVSISPSAFANCTGLTSVVLPNSLKYLSYSGFGSGAFYRCENLVNIVIPASVQYMYTDFAENCYNLQNIYYNGTMTDYINCDIKNDADKSFTKLAKNFYISDENGTHEFNGNKYSPLTTLVITEDITTIAQNQFYNFDYITTVIISASVTNIGYGAFAECSNIANVYYCGTEEQWNQITFENFNEPITNATITYNYVVE